MAAVIELQNIHMKISSDAGIVNILNGISLAIAPARSLSIVGPSGSGKTTLLMILSGLENVSEGKVLFDGQDIGIVFQNFHLIPNMTALENVAVPLELHKDKEAVKKATAALEAVGLSHRLTHYPSQLSGGEQQRVALARAIVHEPKVILADEPTGNLDSVTGQKVIDLLFAVAKKTGAALVIVTHDEKLAALTDHKIHINDGYIVKQDAKVA
jgi:putative ABC transport system ATP-binding protein